MFADNLISANRWGGIDIRRGSDPRVSHNYVCNGLADGVVIGQKGRGTIEANTIKGTWVATTASSHMTLGAQASVCVSCG